MATRKPKPAAPEAPAAKGPVVDAEPAKKPAKPKGKEVVVKPAEGQLALFEDELAAMAQESLAAEQSSLSTTFLSAKGGILSYRGEPVADNKLDVIILAGPIEQLYYSERYDPNKIVPPSCFAIGQMATTLAPDPSVENPQHANCKDCPMNQWNSDPQGGKGKACRETRRLLLIPADAMESVEQVKLAEVAAFRPPVTSLKNYATYVQTLAAFRRPPLGVVTEISVAPDPKTQFKVSFRMVQAIEDRAILGALLARSKDAIEKALRSGGLGEPLPDGAPVVETKKF